MHDAKGMKHFGKAISMLDILNTRQTHTKMGGAKYIRTTKAYY